VKKETETSSCAKDACKLHDSLSQIQRALEAKKAEVAFEEHKTRLMRNGIQAKEQDIERQKRHHDNLEAKQKQQVEESANIISEGRALDMACAVAEEAYRTRELLLACTVPAARRLHNEHLTLKGNIRVFCRIRPRLPAENCDILKYEIRNISLMKLSSVAQKSVTGTEQSHSWDFNFDHIFGTGSTQESVFEEISLLVQSALDGYRVALFAYGQTGSGKTHTMEGFAAQEMHAPSECNGVIPRAVDLIFAQLQELKAKGWTFTVQASCLEVYNETVIDVLSSPKMRSDASQPSSLSQAHHSIDGVAVAGRGERQCESKVVGNISENRNSQEVFQCRSVQSASMLHALFRRASRERHVAATSCNDRSSRSHAIFQIFLTGQCSSEANASEVQGQLSFIDLAGSERVDKSNATGDRLKEAQHINRSLSALGDVIEAISRRGQVGGHIPYRNSRLTMLLKESLGGNAKALMFVNISPLAQHLGETLSSLRFAAKVHTCNVGVAKRCVTDSSQRQGADFNQRQGRALHSMTSSASASSSSSRWSSRSRSCPPTSRLVDSGRQSSRSSIRCSREL